MVKASSQLTLRSRHITTRGNSHIVQVSVAFHPHPVRMQHTQPLRYRMEHNHNRYHLDKLLLRNRNRYHLDK
jgi:hypothetical protein